VPNGVPVNDNAWPRAAPAGGWTLGMVALFRPRKGAEVLLEAVAALRSRGHDVRVRAIGPFETESYEAELQRLADRLHVADLVDWVGFTDDVAAELQQVDALALPSLFGEGLPMVVLEAMAAGLPVVATRCEGVAEAVVHRETGLLVEAGSVSQLSQAIEELVTGRVGHESMSAHAIERHADRFSDAVMAGRVADIYREVLGLPRVAAGTWREGAAAAEQELIGV
ncbi:MAG: glycosyltransferase, partial [Planctomycetota bacterium]